MTAFGIIKRCYEKLPGACKKVAYAAVHPLHPLGGLEKDLLVKHLVSNIVMNEDDGNAFLITSLSRNLSTLSLGQLKDSAMVMEAVNKSINLENFPVGYFLHGSGSASLPFVAEEGLKPKGQLIKEGKVPFLGEISNGSIGINMEHISTTDARSPRWSRSYSNVGTRTWSVEKSKEDMNEHEMRLSALRLELRESKLTVQAINARNKFIRIYEQALEIERARQERWELLSEEQKKAIREPFPVMYLIKYYGKTSIAFSDSKEYLIPGAVPQKDIIAFVPKDKLETAKKMAGGKLEVRSDDEMEAYIKNAVQNDNMYLRVIKMAIEASEKA